MPCSCSKVLPRMWSLGSQMRMFLIVSALPARSMASGAVLQLEGGDLDVAQAHRGLGGLDVPGDVGLLLLGLVRLHLHALHELRVDRAGHHGDERPQADPEDRQRPAAAPDVDDEEHEAATMISSSRLMAGSWALTSV